MASTSHIRVGQASRSPTEGRAVAIARGWRARRGLRITERMVRLSPGRFPSQNTPTDPAQRDPFDSASASPVRRTSEIAAVDRLEIRSSQPELSDFARDPSLKPVVDGMLRRLDASESRIDGRSPRDLFEQHILNNPKVTDDQIRRMAEVTVDQVGDSRRGKRRTLRRFPDVRESINHRFTVDLIAGITGMDPKALSEAKPSLGLTGSAQSVLSPLWKSSVPEVQQFTAIHDATSVLQSAGVDGLNRAVWGQGSSAVSAVLNFPLGAQLRSFFGFGR